MDVLEDLSVFFRDLGGMIDGFVARADRVAALLSDADTTFLIVTSPRHDPVEEAIFFHRRLRDAGMAVRRPGGEPHARGADRGRPVPTGLAEELGDRLAAG